MGGSGPNTATKCDHFEESKFYQNNMTDAENYANTLLRQRDVGNKCRVLINNRTAWDLEYTSSAVECGFFYSDPTWAFGSGNYWNRSIKPGKTGLILGSKNADTGYGVTGYVSFRLS